MNSTVLRRLGALVAASALTVSGLTLVTSPANAAADPRPVVAGSTWLADQLTNGLIHNTQYDFDDLGLSIDAGLALSAVGGNGATVTSIDTALKGAISDYITGESFGDAGSSYAGPIAKAAVFASLAGSDPASYGGKDLVALLEARVSSTAPVAGRIEDLSSFGTDYANVIGQAFAVNALSTAISDKRDEALSFLLKQQCSAGYFRLYMTADKTATDQTCDGGRAAGDSAADPDATSTAIRLLLPQIGTSTTVARAIGKAEAWLLAQQHADGSFGGGTSTGGANTNSTGLAGWALGLLGDDEAASQAAVWVRTRQVDEVGSCSSAAPNGSIAYNDAALATGIGTGIDSAAEDQWRRATSQGLPVLHWAPSASPAVTIKGPEGYVRAGSAVSYLVTGVVPGDKVCLTGMGSPRRGVAGLNGFATIRLIAPSGTADRVVNVADRDANVDQTTTQVLGPVPLKVSLSRARVHRGHLVRVTVTRLAPGERVTLRFRGAQVRTGTASSTGVYVARFNVHRKLGKTQVRAYGQFPTIRKGAATITVIR